MGVLRKWGEPNEEERDSWFLSSHSGCLRPGVALGFSLKASPDCRPIPRCPLGILAVLAPPWKWSVTHCTVFIISISSGIPIHSKTPSSVEFRFTSSFLREPSIWETLPMPTTHSIFADAGVWSSLCNSTQSEWLRKPTSC